MSEGNGVQPCTAPSRRPAARYWVVKHPAFDKVMTTAERENYRTEKANKGDPSMRTLTTFLFLLAVVFIGQAQVYSVGVYSMGRTYERDWTIGNSSMRFGFEQFLQYQDASGRDLHSFSDVTALAVASPRYTTVYFGPLHFTVRGRAGPAAAVSAIISVILASLLLLLARECAEFGGVTLMHSTPPNKESASRPASPLRTGVSSRARRPTQRVRIGATRICRGRAFPPADA
jgi:hypothetical protein